MENIYYNGEVLWSQVDANRHLRHSAYADLAAQARINLLEHVGLSAKFLGENNIGPILFREETIYFREIALNDRIRVSCELTKARKDGSRFSFKHSIFRSDDVLAASIVVDGAWIDMNLRKLAVLPEIFSAKFKEIPKAEIFVWE